MFFKTTHEKPNEQLSEIASWWIGYHWSGGLFLPKDFDELPIEEKLYAIYDAQNVGEIHQPCASLDEVVYINDEKEEFLIAKLQWESGSGRGALFMDGTRDKPLIVMVDAGTTATDEFELIKEKADAANIEAIIVTVHCDGNAKINATKVLEIIEYKGIFNLDLLG